ncbi:MAG: hypothetical protein JNK05_20645 [Myxococcales bacterium]|nr:hypothetical protein [Myxococcales bacterium]
MAELSIAAYVAPLVEGRRVAVVGPTSAELARRLRSLGAQSVVAIGGSGDGVAVRPLNHGAIEAFRGRVDCVVVPDADAVSFTKVMDEARRALGRDGLVVAAVSARTARAKGAVDYHALRGALEERFGFVKMVGCGAFAGFTLATLEASDADAPSAFDDVTLDTRLMPETAESPELYIGFAADARFDVDALAIVQVPASSEAAPSADPSLFARIEASERAASAANDAARAANERAAAAAAAAEAASASLATSRTDLRRASQRVTELERALATAETAANETRAALAQAERDRDSARKDLHAARKESREREQGAGEDVSRLERSLIEKGRECAALEAKASERDAAVRELLYQIDALRGADGSQRMAALEARNAELGALHAAVGAEANRVALQNDVLRERVAKLESTLEAREAESRQLEFQLSQARATSVSATRAREEALVAQRHAEELSRVRSEYESRLSSARSDEEALARRIRAEIEAERALEQVEQAARAARARDEADEEAARLRADLEANRRRAADAELALKNTLDRFAALEASESEARARAASAETRLSEQAKLVAPPSAPIAAPAQDNAALHAALARAAELEAELAATKRASDSIEKSANDVRAQLDSALRAEDDLQEQLSNVRAELSRQFALSASIEDRVAQLSLELEGTKKGYTRRVRELEREVEQLVRALEVASSSASEEGEAVVAVQRELDAAQAERNGIAMRLADAEAALSALSERASASREESPAPRDASREASESALASDAPPASDHRAEQLLATLAETAARLASTEESMVDLRAQLDASLLRTSELEEELRASRARAAEATASPSRAAEAPSSAELEALRRENSERELLVRSLVAQLEDRDLRLRAIERRLVEEVERARRTESEIWELELRARDQRIAAMQREIERGGDAVRTSSNPSAEAELAKKSAEAEAGRRAIERVRASLSTILVDGRGAGVSHELVALLRQLDEAESQ